MPGRDVEPEALRGGPVELQARVHVGQVDVRADLDRPVGGVGEGQLAALVRSAIGVELQLARLRP